MHTTPRPTASPPSPRRGRARQPISTQGLLNLSVVYIVWSSTYLAIRVGVRPGAGFPPFSLSFTRVVLAGGFLLIWGKLRGDRLTPTPREAGILLLSGMLFWMGGNGLVTWAEQRAESGFTALLIGSAPIWAALIESLIDHRRPSTGLALSLLTGFAGIATLSLPAAMDGIHADATSALALLGAAVAWSCGVVVQNRRPVDLSPWVSSAYQQLSGGAGLGLLMLLTREPTPDPSPAAWAAWGYLVIFGSVFAFTSFIQAIRRLPINVTMTYAYVNPVLAVLLGALILDEEITLWAVLGAALVVLGVAGVFRERR
jgi:drug/metabolite transporter (DMT)-like permease